MHNQQSYHQCRCTKVDGSVKITGIFGSNVFTQNCPWVLKWWSFLKPWSFCASQKSDRSQAKPDPTDPCLGQKKARSPTGSATHVPKKTRFFHFYHKGDGTPIEQFEGDSLQQEPDASSFPSGGLRATFWNKGLQHGILLLPHSSWRLVWQNTLYSYHLCVVYRWITRL